MMNVFFIHLSVEIWISVLRIDPTNFKATDDLGRERLIFRMLLRSLDLLKVKFEKARPKLDAKVYEELERLKNDALNVAKDESWI